MKSVVAILAIAVSFGLIYCTRNKPIELHNDEAVLLPGHLGARIGRPDPSKYQSIRDALNWKNPYLIVYSDHFEIRHEGGTQEVAADALATSLIHLPLSAWPYGRIIAMQEAGVRGIKDSEPIRRNMQNAETILKALGLVISLWPSA